MKRGDIFYTASSGKKLGKFTRFLRWFCQSHHPEFKAVWARRFYAFDMPYGKPVLRSDSDTLTESEMLAEKAADKRAWLLDKYADILPAYRKHNGDPHKVCDEVGGYMPAIAAKCRAIRNHKLA